jgi:DNA-binding transcriptional ArsR family regulator
MPNSREPTVIAGRAAPVFAALGDPTRLGIIASLCAGGPISTIRLTTSTQLSRQGVTKHLRVLEGAGIVSSTREGRDLVWELQRKYLDDASSYLLQISAQWDRALERLRYLVEVPPAA